MQITVIAGPRRAARPRSAMTIGLGIGGTLTAVVAVATLAMSGSPSHAGQGDQRARAPGPAGVAAAYGYPVRCLSVTIAVHDPRFARADLNHRVSCGGYTGYETAIFRRAAGAWVAVLEAVSYPCPLRALPPQVQVELGVCLPPAAAHTRRARGSSRVSAATRTSRPAN